MLPFRTPFIFPLLYPRLTWRWPTDQKKIYLTFDDGPVPGPTNFVLEQLHAYNAHATFFCIGQNVEQHPGLFNQVKAAGHTIGNHTFNHISGWGCSAEVYKQDVNRCQEVVGDTCLFRPPDGRISRAAINRLKAYHIVMWDVLTFDYSAAVSPARCLQGTIQAIRPGSIVVFHDSYKAEKNMNYALPRLLDHCTSSGYSLESLVNSLP